MAEIKLNNENKSVELAESYEYSDTFSKKFQIFWRRFRKNKMAVIGLTILIILYSLAIFAPFIAPYDPAGTADDIMYVDGPPTFRSYVGYNVNGEEVVFKPNFFGRDELGRDVFSRCIYAGRISLTVGFVSVSIYVLIGTVWGAIAGYYGGKVDNIMMRIVDAIMSIPTMMLLITVMAIFKPNLYNVMIVIGLTGWTGIARYVRAEFLSLKKRDFVEAARCIGASNTAIIFRHILPNAIAPVIVAATMGLASAILTESTLSFFGLGVQPPTPSWGNMLTNAQELETMVSAPWKAFWPGLFIFLSVLSFNFVGDGLRDALDPRLKQ
ncbi:MULTISPECIES: oligopeptide ABC transporter permease [Caloramator]|uniref:Dipeptide transport system permease protein DppC (TC 3.A.1.5.2) n=1 Tax=Caloramator australicus RC3 TaxID=857293 RepID=G0V4P6_9CLOT|nr:MULTISPECIES: oligopeptide ABC transporter permease [Caloramator]MDO6353590.1 ABC transporter permease [Caloramator sp. CAR-1]CCC58086.1 Dipeptide transport system permease protein DppC (TC 3.A.1.5.2) [Caloramator australicus RC3]